MTQIKLITADKNGVSMEEYLHKELTSSMIHAFYKVYNTLGFGFLEKVYRNSMRIELSGSGFFVVNAKTFKCLL